MDFTIVGELTNIEVIARGNSIQRRKILIKRYGGKNWRKMKGVATIRTLSGSISVGRGPLVRSPRRRP